MPMIGFGLGGRSRTSTVIAPNDVACQLADTQNERWSGWHDSNVRTSRFQSGNSDQAELHPDGGWLREQASNLRSRSSRLRVLPSRRSLSGNRGSGAANRTQVATVQSRHGMPTTRP